MALKYLQGFGNHFVSEAEKGILPEGQNSPQKVARGLYAEQISGSAFTAPRKENYRSWVYRIRPSVLHGDFAKPYKHPTFVGDFAKSEAPPTQMRWSPLEKGAAKGKNFLEGIHSLAGCGGPNEFKGCALHLYAATESMKNAFFYNADAEMMIVPQDGNLLLRTEMGQLELSPLEIAVIPKGIRFAVDLDGKFARGYLFENFGRPFVIPDLGPIGANGLANPRDFQAPVAAYEKGKAKTLGVAKFQGAFWQDTIEHSPFDVVGWHGNYCPYKYNLKYFNTINSVSFDHPDPSIFTVLTSPSEQAGTANVDFVIFPPRWMVAEHSFRPPYFHRNVMNELMGLIEGVYDAKEEGFVPGGTSLHNCMSGHGPDAETFEKASNAKLTPQKLSGTMAFMFESRLPYRVCDWALKGPARQKDYVEVWSDLPVAFK
jgi:homogentisate 1,2-dioxygenase